MLALKVTVLFFIMSAVTSRLAGPCTTLFLDTISFAVTTVTPASEAISPTVSLSELSVSVSHTDEHATGLKAQTLL